MSTDPAEPAGVLVLEDEPDIRALIIREAERMGLRTFPCATAQQALDHPGPFSLALLDVLLAEMSGVQVAHELRRRPQTADLPIIFVTIVDAPPDIADLDPPATVVHKPFDRADLRRAIARALGTPDR